MHLEIGGSVVLRIEGVECMVYVCIYVSMHDVVLTENISR